MAAIRFRQAGAGDFDALLRLLAQMDESMYGSRAQASTSEVRALYNSVLKDPDQRLLLAGDGDRLVGSAHLMVLRHLDRHLLRSGVLEGIVVDPEYRRGGVGAGLMRAAAEAAHAHAEVFAEVKPAATMVEVSRLADPAMLVEIEAVAVV